MIQPNMIDFYNWWASLVVDFPNDNIPFLDNEDDWKEAGNLLVQEDSFARNNAPSTIMYSDKWEWACDVYYTVGQDS